MQWFYIDTIMVPSDMPTLTLKNLPPETYRRLKEAARAHRRSLNSELIVCVERALGMRPASAEEIRRRAEELRARWQGPSLTLREIDRSKREGRP